MANPPDPSEPPKPPAGKASRSLRQFMARDNRERLWAFLDFMDDRPALKKGLLVGIPLFALAVGFGIWEYRNWSRTNAVRIARQWIDAGRLDRAETAIRDALTNEPELPASWRLASELSWLKGNRESSVAYAKKAAVVSRYQADDVLAWADASILSGDVTQAQEAVTFLNPAEQGSSRAMRVIGEIARRRRSFEQARGAFGSALQADAAAGLKPLAVDEIPLGIVCLQTGSEADASRGRALLGKWASDITWGIDALRALLADAVAHGDREGVTRWAEALQAHPRCTLGDVPVCLKALIEFNPARSQAMVSQLEKKGLKSPTEAAQLMGWLTQAGEGAEALRWGATLDASASRRPPLVAPFAEAMRRTERWTDLRSWVDGGEWGRDLEFMGWSYGLLAARKAGDTAKAESLWKSLNAEAGTNAAHALLVGDMLISWGYPDDGAKFLWLASERPDLAYLALGSLARLYEVQRDAVGQYRAFARLNSMRPGDRDVANNFAYYAAVTDLGNLSQVERLAEDNYNHEPANATYRSTFAFVLVCSGQATRALALMEPVSREARNSRAVAFAYASALAGMGRKSEARELFDSLDPRLMSSQEINWILTALR